MKKSYFCALLAAIMCFACLDAPAVFAAADSRLVILFTHDMHSHIEPSAYAKDDAITEYGGFAALAELISGYREREPELLLVDGGDFSMGSLYQTIFSTQAPELRLMGAMGYDAVTLGNHEFDFKAGALTQMLIAAQKSGEPIPQLVTSNIDPQAELGAEQKGLLTELQEIGAKKYTIVKKNGLRIGIFGIMGKSAATFSSDMSFTDPAATARSMIASIKADGGADMIVCLSHSGTDDERARSEDEQLAAAVPEIDLIVSAHTHTALEQPIIAGKTTIVSAGEYTKNLGTIELTRGTDGRWSPSAYSLVPIDPAYADADIEKKIDEFRTNVQSNYLDKFGMEFDQVLAASDYNLQSYDDMFENHADSALGSLFSDAYEYGVKELGGADDLDAAIVNAGSIRDSFTKGEITAARVFEACSLGLGPDGLCTYPLVTACLTGAELKNIAELDASATPMLPETQFFISGMTYTFNPNRIIFNRVTEAYLTDDKGQKVRIEDNKLYKVAADSYVMSFIGLVREKTFGIIDLVPKDEDGAAITDITKRIVRDGSGAELKTWTALAAYMQSFQKKDGVPQLSSYYNKPHGRKTRDESASMIVNLNKVSYIVIGASVLALALAAFVIYRIATHRRRVQKKQLKKVAKK